MWSSWRGVCTCCELISWCRWSQLAKRKHGNSSMQEMFYSFMWCSRVWEAPKVVRTCVQEIIALRAYSSSIAKTIKRDKDSLRHQQILFVVIAFRVLLMYTLPIIPKKELGVQQVAKVLPNYAKNLTFSIQPDTKTQKRH